MSADQFIRWALDDARTLEERFSVERVIETGIQRWNMIRAIPPRETFEEAVERKRQQALNPAYEPHYTAQALERAYEGWVGMKSCYLSSFNERPMRSLAPLRFFPWIESVDAGFCQVDDLSPLIDLPVLNTIHFGSSTCRDYRPLSRCKAITDLQIKFGKYWPEVRGLNDLPNLKTLKLQGNLLVFEGAVFPHVIFGALVCEPLPAANVRAMPQLPSCQFLHLSGAETLDGIEAFGQVRNLVLGSETESFGPIERLTELTCLTVLTYEPVDLAPLTRVPKLQYLSLDTSPIQVKPVKPRDVSQLIDSPSLRELQVRGSTIIQTEAAAVQAGLPSWNDLFRRTEPQPIPRLRLRALPMAQMPRRDVDRMPGEPELVDIGLRACELRWFGRQVQRAITRKLGTADWGEVQSYESRPTHPAPHIFSPTHRTLSVQFHCFALLDKYPLFIEAIRECLAWMIPDYGIHVGIYLKAPRREPTPAQIAMEEEFRRQCDEAEYEQHRRDMESYLERLHRFELKKQEGSKVDPAEFAPDATAPLPVPPWEREDEDGGGDDDAGGIAVKEKVEPPPSWDDEEHPLASNYYLIGFLTLDTLSVLTQHRGVAEYLLQRACDEVIEEPPRQ